MLAREANAPFDDPDWLFEIKWDGYRAIADLNKKGILLYSRNGKDFSKRYETITEHLKNIDATAVLDGEIVVLDDKGHPNFQYLQHFSENKDKPIQFQIFDLLYLEGKDAKELPLEDRKSLLKEIIPEDEVIRYCDHVRGKGKSFFKAAGEMLLEGIMAKNNVSRYLPGKRTDQWLKIKHQKSIEALIAGYTEPTGSRKYFGALILGVWEGADLKYIGHTGTGFNDRQLKELYEEMQSLIINDAPFPEKVKTNTPATWIRPVLIAEVKYTEMTRDAKLRHPVFLRLRKDKPPEEIKAEAMTSPLTHTKQNKKNKKKSAKKNRNTTAHPKEKLLSFGKYKVKITHPGKVYFPKEGLTKNDVINYYQSISDYILPHLKGRPQSLLRHPNGIEKKGFFHKDAGDNAPSFVQTEKVWSESSDRNIDYIICNNRATLAYLNNLGSIELNPWHSTIKQPDHPDYLMIDIDPSSKNTFDEVVEAARAVKEVLDRAGATGYCKTSGATGMHVYVPVHKKYTFDEVKDFARLICMLVEKLIPDIATLERNLKKRSNKKIYLDYLQNRKSQTLACAYSLRPKPGATVSAPLEWKEVKKGLRPRDFTLFNMKERLEKKGDLFRPVLGKGIDMEKCIRRLQEAE